MTDDLAARVAAIDAATLLPLIERALGTAVRHVGDWEFTTVAGGYGARVWRFQGHAEVEHSHATWSMILKIPSEGVGLGDPWGGIREPIIYRSGFRAPVLDGLTLPR